MPRKRPPSTPVAGTTFAPAAPLPELVDEADAEALEPAALAEEALDEAALVAE